MDRRNRITSQDTSNGSGSLGRQWLGRQCQRLADDFNGRALDKCRARGHRRIRTAHTALIEHIAHRPLRLADLARQVGVSQQAVGKLVRELERAGYLNCAPLPGDRRSFHISLTPQGQQLLTDFDETLVEVRGEYRILFGADTFGLLERSLQLAMASIRTQRPLPDLQAANVGHDTKPTH